MTDFTEQWKKGELPKGEEYWVILTDEWYSRNPVEPVRAFYSCECEFEGYLDDDIKEVLDKVPTYQEYQALLSDQLAKNEGVEINAELKAIIKKREIKINELYEDIDRFADSNLDLIKNIETLVQTLLKVSPEHREWLETNFKEYL